MTLIQYPVSFFINRTVEVEEQKVEVIAIIVLVLEREEVIRNVEHPFKPS